MITLPIAIGSCCSTLSIDFEQGRTAIALAFNKAVADGRLKAPVVLSRDHHDVSGTDSPFRETSNIRDGSMFCADMAVHNFVGDAFHGATYELLTPIRILHHLLLLQICTPTVLRTLLVVFRSFDLLIAVSSALRRQSRACHSYGIRWVALHNGGGTGWGEAINGGFGMVLDGSEDAARKAQQMLFWCDSILSVCPSD